MTWERESSDFEAEEIALLRASNHLPSPEELRAYEEISPGSADRLIRIMELQQRMIREEMELHERTRRAAYFAKIFARVLLWITVMGTFGTAAFLVARGFHGSAYVLALISVLPLVVRIAVPLWKSGHELSGHLFRRNKGGRGPE